MNIKLPLILSTMIAALAVPGFAEDAAPAEGEMAPATEAAAAPEAKATPKKKRHHRKHRAAQRHAPSKWDAPWDYIEKTTTETTGCGAETVTETSPQLPVEEVPGQKTAPWPGTAN